MAQSEFMQVLGASIEASISVLLTLAYGGLAFHFGLMNSDTVRASSKVVAYVFLPLLIVTKVGPELTVEKLRDLWIVPAWSVIVIGGGHIWGYLAHKLFKMPAWISPACGLVNAAAYPLLMLSSLKASGLVDRLTFGDESVDEALNRGSSYILLNSVVQQSAAFFFAPRIMEEDRKDEEAEHERLEPGQRPLNDIEQDREHVGLLVDFDGRPNEEARKPVLELDGHLQRHPSLETPKWAEKPVSIWKKITDWLSPPIYAAIIALLLGATPALHKAFFSEDGLFEASITESLRNLGDLYVSLQAFLLGCLLYEQQVQHRHWAPLWPSLFVLVTRFLLAPALALLALYHTAGTGLYKDDPMLWVVLILMASGPTALILSTLAQISDVDVAPVSGFLVLTYVLSPLLSVTVSLTFAVIDKVQER